MKKHHRQFGMTLTEVLVAVSLIAILLGSIFGLGRRLILQSEIRLTESTMNVLCDALEIYLNADFYHLNTGGKKDLVSIPNRFPLVDLPHPDLTTIPVTYIYGSSDLVDDLEQYLDLYDGSDDVSTPTSISQGSNENEYASSEALYFFLNDYPDAAVIVNALNEQMISKKDEDGTILQATVPTASLTTETIELFRYIDAWGTSFLYSYDPDSDVFPVIRSAGPDKEHGTADDIVSSEL